MRKLCAISCFILLTSLLSIQSCKKVFDPTGELLYYTSFEQESELDDWEGLSSSNFSNDTPGSGGDNSVFISGGCVMPTAKYTLKAVGVEQIVSFSCYGKNLTSGGSVYLKIEDEKDKEISIYVDDKTWIHYECSESIVWPANKDLSICLFSGGFVGSSMLIDEIRLLKKR